MKMIKRFDLLIWQPYSHLVALYHFSSLYEARIKIKEVTRQDTSDTGFIWEIRETTVRGACKDDNYVTLYRGGLLYLVDDKDRDCTVYAHFSCREVNSGLIKLEEFSFRDPIRYSKIHETLDSLGYFNIQGNWPNPLLYI